MLPSDLISFFQLLGLRVQRFLVSTKHRVCFYTTTLFCFKHDLCCSGLLWAGTINSWNWFDIWENRQSVWNQGWSTHSQQATCSLSGVKLQAPALVPCFALLLAESFPSCSFLWLTVLLGAGLKETWGLYVTSALVQWRSPSWAGRQRQGASHPCVQGTCIVCSWEVCETGGPCIKLGVGLAYAQSSHSLKGSPPP